jgi:hypothetical protein
LILFDLEGEFTDVPRKEGRCCSLGRNTAASSEEIESYPLTKEQESGLPSHSRDVLHWFEGFSFLDMPFHPVQEQKYKIPLSTVLGVNSLAS